MTTLEPAFAFRHISVAVAAILAVALTTTLLPATGGFATVDETSITVPDGSINGLQISLALDAAGNPVVSYLDAFDHDLKVLHCNDAKCAGGDESLRTPAGQINVGTHSSLLLDAAGNPVVSHYDDANRDLRLLHCDDPNCSGFPESQTAPDTDGDVGSHTSLALDTAGNPVVAHYDATNGTLRLTRCDDPNCEGDSSASPAAMAADAPFISLALNGDGNPVVAFRNATSALAVLTCDDPACDGDESTNITTPDGENGREGSLTLAAGGNPVIAFVHGEERQLRLLVCSDTACSGGDESVVTLDAAGFAHTPSLALASGEAPVVAYYDCGAADLANCPTGDLKLATCADLTCGSGVTTRTLDSAGDVGLGASLALDDDVPVIAYLHRGGQDLKLLRCATVGCVSPAGPSPSPMPPTDPPPTATPTPLPPTATPAVVSGDADCSSTVNAIDAALILQYVARLVATLPCPDSADANGDSNVSATDAAFVLQFVAGLISHLPAGIRGQPPG